MNFFASLLLAWLTTLLGSCSADTQFISVDTLNLVKDYVAINARNPGLFNRKLEEDNDDKLMAFLDWLESGGAEFSLVEIKQYSDVYRATVAINDISANEPIIQIPLNLIITNVIAQESSIVQQLKDITFLNDQTKLACFLLVEREKRKNSQWYRYIAMLPPNYHNFPYFLDKYQRDLLKGSFTLSMIDTEIKDLNIDYSSICEAVSDFCDVFLFDDFIWARLAVMTRLFQVTINGAATDVMVPFADFLNHEQPSETTWSFDDARNAFIIQSSRDIPKGQEITDSYGSKCNSRYFVHYGFTVEDNPPNKAVISFQLNKDHIINPDFQLSNEVVMKIKVPATIEAIEDAVAWLRTAYATPSQLEWISPEHSISTHVEILALVKLSRAATDALEAFPQTLEDDEQLLEDIESYPPFSVDRNIIVMRRGEKQVLRFFMELVINVKPWIDMDSDEFGSSFPDNTDDWDGDKEVYDYIKRYIKPLKEEHAPHLTQDDVESSAEMPLPDHSEEDNTIAATVPLISDEQKLWTSQWNEYQCTFIDYNVVDKTAEGDPTINALVDPNGVSHISFNTVDGDIDRTSSEGYYEVVNGFLPRNPRGRTGYCGRHMLLYWGPNHIVNPILSRWKRSESGDKISIDGQPILEVLAVSSVGTVDPIPGVSREEVWYFPDTFSFRRSGGAGQILRRQLAHLFSMDFIQSDIDKETMIEHILWNCHKNFIYKGYATDDWRNTDNAWVETTVIDWHDESGEFTQSLKLKKWDTSQPTRVAWLTVNANIDLMPIHKTFAEKVTRLHNAYW